MNCISISMLTISIYYFFLYFFILFLLYYILFCSGSWLEISIYATERKLKTHWKPTTLLFLNIFPRKIEHEKVSYFTAVSSATSMETVIIPADSRPAVLTHSASSVIYNTHPHKISHSQEQSCLPDRTQPSWHITLTQTHTCSPADPPTVSPPLSDPVWDATAPGWAELE